MNALTSPGAPCAGAGSFHRDHVPGGTKGTRPHHSGTATVKDITDTTTARTEEAAMTVPVRDMKSRNVVSLAMDLLALSGNDAAIAEAVELAAFAHDGTLRKEHRPDTDYLDPYVIHPIRVALRLIRLCGEPDELPETGMLVAALLHDVLEDAPERVARFYDQAPEDEMAFVARAVLAQRFGTEVLDAVVRVTNPAAPAALPAGTTAARRAELKNQRYLAHLRQQVLPDRWATAVKGGDLVDNAGSLHWMEPGPRRDALAAKYREPVALVAGAAREHGMAALAARLDRVRATLDTLV